MLPALSVPGVPVGAAACFATGALSVIGVRVGRRVTTRVGVLVGRSVGASVEVGIGVKVGVSVGIRCANFVGPTMLRATTREGRTSAALAAERVVWVIDTTV